MKTEIGGILLVLFFRNYHEQKKLISEVSYACVEDQHHLSLMQLIELLEIDREELLSVLDVDLSANAQSILLATKLDELRGARPELTDVSVHLLARPIPADVAFTDMMRVVQLHFSLIWSRARTLYLDKILDIVAKAKAEGIDPAELDIYSTGEHSAVISVPYPSSIDGQERDRANRFLHSLAVETEDRIYRERMQIRLPHPTD